RVPRRRLRPPRARALAIDPRSRRGDRSRARAASRQSRRLSGPRMINLDHVVLIGPGSEWFWTAISGLILAVTFVAIYRQVRLQRSAEAIAQATAFGREFFGEHLSRHQLAILSALDAGVAPAAVSGGSATELLNFFERIGFLARGGHVDVRIIW